MNIISNKKLEANRRNALKSTGPKTKEGKLFASQNALKHGLNAEKFLVIGENLEEVNAFVPPQSKLSAEELQKQMEKESELQKEKEAKVYEKKQALQKEKERIKRNQEAYEREKRYISFCNPYEPINKNRLGHSKIIKKKKNYNYY